MVPPPLHLPPPSHHHLPPPSPQHLPPPSPQHPAAFLQDQPSLHLKAQHLQAQHFRQLIGSSPQGSTFPSSPQTQPHVKGLFLGHPPDHFQGHPQGLSPQGHLPQDHLPQGHPQGHSPYGYPQGVSPQDHPKGHLPPDHSQGFTPEGHLQVQPQGHSPQDHPQGHLPPGHHQGQPLGHLPQGYLRGHSPQGHPQDHLPNQASILHTLHLPPPNWNNAQTQRDLSKGEELYLLLSMHLFISLILCMSKINGQLEEKLNKKSLVL